MKKGISLTIAAVMLMILLAACAPAQPKATPTPSPAMTPTPAPTPEATEEATGDDADDTADVTTPEGLEDGKYVGKTDKDDRGSYGEINLTIADEKITEAEYIEYTEDGKPKSKENGYEYEAALEAFDELPKQLIETQDVEKIDDYSGATGTTNKFRTAAKRALSGSPADEGT